MKNSLNIWIDKANSIHNNEYNYSKVIFEGSKSKIIITCSEHGDFIQRADAHLLGNKCPKCSVKTRSLTLNEFITKSQKIHGQYCYDNVILVNTKTKVEIVCLIHGSFWQTPRSHLDGSGCPKCYYKSRTKTNDQFIKDAIKVHGSTYDYSKVNYINSLEKICIICSAHGEFWQTPNSHLMQHGCPICNNSSMEKFMFNWFIENKLSFTTQYSLRLEKLARYSNKILVDFYLNFNGEEYFIEYDGQQHFEYTPIFHKNGIEDFDRELRRDNVLNEYCETNNLTLIRFTYKQTKEEIINKLKELFK